MSERCNDKKKLEVFVSKVTGVSTAFNVCSKKSMNLYQEMYFQQLATMLLSPRIRYPKEYLKLAVVIPAHRLEVYFLNCIDFQLFAQPYKFQQNVEQMAQNIFFLKIGLSGQPQTRLFEEMEDLLDYLCLIILYAPWAQTFLSASTDTNLQYALIFLPWATSEDSIAETLKYEYNNAIEIDVQDSLGQLLKDCLQRTFHPRNLKFRIIDIVALMNELPASEHRSVLFFFSKRVVKCKIKRNCRGWWVRRVLRTRLVWCARFFKSDLRGVSYSIFVPMLKAIREAFQPEPPSLYEKYMQSMKNK